MWAISLLTTMFLLPLLSAAPLDIAGDIKKEDVKDDNDGMHSHDENVTRGGKFFGHNRFDMGDMNISGSVAGDVVSIGHQVKIDVHVHTHDHHHHEADTVIECKEGFRELFKSIDSNKNGLMDAKELLRVCHQNNIKITKPLAVRILTLPDKTVGFNMAKFCDLLKNCPNTNSADIIHFLLQLFDKIAGCSRDEIQKLCSCPHDYDPVCAGGRLYNNLCLHECARKEAECADVQAIPAVGDIAECVDPSTKGIVNRNAIKEFQMTLLNIEHELANLVNSRRKREIQTFREDSYWEDEYTEDEIKLLKSIENGKMYLEMECSCEKCKCDGDQIQTFRQESDSNFNAIEETGEVSSGYVQTFSREREQFDVIAKVAVEVQEKIAVKGSPLDCTCSDFVSEYGYGQCKKQDSGFGGAYSCYVNLPSNCKDLKESEAIPGFFLSAEACKEGAYNKMEYSSFCSGSWTRITSEATCRAAAAALNFKWGGSWDGPGDFPGCLHTKDSRNRVYFNTSPKPSNNPKINTNYAEICQAQTGLSMAEGCKLFVYGVGEFIGVDDLSHAFDNYGSVDDAYNTGKGYAFITMGSPEEAQAAINGLHGADLFGRTLKVDLAKPIGGCGGGRRYGGGRGGGGGYGGGGDGGYGGGGR